MPFQGDAKTILSIKTRFFDLVDGFFMNKSMHEDGGDTVCNYTKAAVVRIPVIVV